MRLRLGLLGVVGRSVAQIVKVQTLHLGVVIDFLGERLADGQADALGFLVHLENIHAHGLADLHLLGQTAEGDAVQPVQVFIGDLPPPENGWKPFPCIILVPVNGYHEEGGETAVIALICCVYNPEPGDAEGAEQDLAILMSGITRVLGACRETPLKRRFQLVPDHRGRLLAWEKAETKPRPFLQAVMLSQWTMKGWE